MKFSETVAFSMIWLFLVVASFVHAQDKSGIITYKGVVNEKFVDSFSTAYAKKKKPMAVKKAVIDAMKNARPDEYELNFKNGESYYHKKPALVPQGLMDSRAGSTPYYTNIATDKIIEMSRFLGNIAQKPLNWKITNKTKTIGNYKCYKAIVTEKLYSRQGHYYYKDVIAWFTPEIPLSFGPKNYSGLPGLVLQIEDKEYTLTAIKINLNPTEEVKIKRPKKNDKVITQQESYNRIKELEADWERERNR